jgi:hypothetical protein
MPTRKNLSWPNSWIVGIHPRIDCLAGKSIQNDWRKARALMADTTLLMGCFETITADPSRVPERNWKEVCH